MHESDVPPLGKLLLRDRVLSESQLAAALRQQVVFGGRLGTNLLELGYADHDQLAQALGQLHRVPPVLIRHLQSADGRARAMISPRLCIEHAALPLAFATMGGRRLVVCLRDPASAAALADLGREAHMEIVAAACPERTLFRLLAHFCGAPLPARMAQADAPTTPLPSGASGQFAPSHAGDSLEMPPASSASSMPAMPALVLVELDHEAALRDPSQISAESLSLSELADRLKQQRVDAVAAPPPELPREPEPAFIHDAAPRELAPSAPTEGRRRRAASSLSEALLIAASEDRIEAVLSTPVPLGPPPLGLNEALEQIAVAGERAEVSAAVIAYLKSRFSAGLILVVRDDVAYGYRGFGGHFDSESVESILVPLTTTSPFQVAHQERRRYLGAGGGDERSLFGRFLRLFPLTRRPELCVVLPIEVRDRVVCLIYAHSTADEPPSESAFDDLDALAAGIAGAFLRLIRSQRRDLGRG